MNLRQNDVKFESQDAINTAASTGTQNYGNANIFDVTLNSLMRDRDLSAATIANLNNWQNSQNLLFHHHHHQQQQQNLDYQQPNGAFSLNGNQFPPHLSNIAPFSNEQRNKSSHLLQALQNLGIPTSALNVYNNYCAPFQNINTYASNPFASMCAHMPLNPIVHCNNILSRTMANHQYPSNADLRSCAEAMSGTDLLNALLRRDSLRSPQMFLGNEHIHNDVSLAQRTVYPQNFQFPAASQLESNINTSLQHSLSNDIIPFPSLSAHHPDTSPPRPSITPSSKSILQPKVALPEMTTKCDAVETSESDKIRFKPFHEEKWNDRLDELKAFKNKYGHCLVPHTFPENPYLARWVKRQRRQFKLLREGHRSTMTEERVAILNDCGFVWDSHEINWNERYLELLKYKLKYGHCLVPSGYKKNPQLATWVKCQRRQSKLFHENKPSSMTQSRIEKLNKLDFDWEVRTVQYDKK